MLSPSSVRVPSTDWCEPVLLWLTVSMPTGSGKSTLFRHLYSLLEKVRQLCDLDEQNPAWVVDDASFEKMGALMNENQLDCWVCMTSYLPSSHKSIFIKVEDLVILMSLPSSSSYSMDIHGVEIQVHVHHTKKSYSSTFINAKKQQSRKVKHLTKMIYQQCAVFTRLS